MKPQSIPLSIRKGTKSSHERGFALVVVLSLMVLLAILSVGLLSLSAITLRNTSNNTSMEIARQNARLALSMAIGELQKELGPDQRISANASILDSSPNSESIDGVENPNWVGVWDSWRGQNHYIQSRDGMDALIPDISDNRQSSFRKWLVSTPDVGGVTSQVEDLNFAKNFNVPTDAVTLVGEGTVGRSLSSENTTVHAPLVPVPTPGSRGAYAWWVGDESQKAIVRPGIEESGRDRPLTALNEADSPSTVALDLFDEFESAPEREDLLKGTVSRNNLSLMQGARDLRPLFHEITSHAKSVMADVREGGLKRDINLMAEAYSPNIDDAQRGLPVSDENIMYNFGDGRNVPIHDLLNYYTLYKAEGINGGKILNTGSGKPFIRPLGPSEMRDGEITNLYRQPVLARVQFGVWARAVIPNQAERPEVFPIPSNARGPYMLEFRLAPYISLWNPYNVPLALNGDLNVIIRDIALGFQTVDISRGMQFTRTSTLNGLSRGDVKSPPGGDQQIVNDNDLERASTFANLLITDTSPMEPGELRIYSINADAKEMVMTPQHMVPGYLPLHGPVVSEYAIGISDGAGVGINHEEYRYAMNGVIGVKLEPRTEGTGVNTTLAASFKKALKYGQFFTVDVRPMGVPDALRRRDYNTQTFRTQLNSSMDVKNDLIKLGNPGDPPRTPELHQYRISELATSSGQLAVLYSFGPSGEYESRTEANFRNRPFLHAMPTHASPWIESSLAEKAYDSGWRFSIFKGQEAINEISNAGRNTFYGGGWGSTGQRNVVHYEIPQRPFHSLSQFSNAFLGGWSTSRQTPDTGGITQGTTSWGLGGLLPHVSKAIGNSYAHPGIPQAAAFTMKNIVRDANTPRDVPYVDHSYLANYALWDEYFMSSIASHTGGLYDASNAPDSFTAQELAQRFFSRNSSKLPNHRFTPKAGPIWEELQSLLFDGSSASQEAEKIIARYLLLEGGFNVNSTSKTAWKALLAGLKGTSTPVLSSGSNSGSPAMVSNTGTPLNAVSIPTGGALPAGSADPSNQNEPWVGYFELTDGQIDTLAEEIVKQVKQRGPFLSLSDFVNRRLSNNTQMALYGTIQTAIEEAGLNSNFPLAAAPGGGGMSFREAAEGSTAYGSSAYIDQADVLRNIDSVIVPRGDTFVIRAYGDSRDQAGNIISRAWCEAVVQRTTDYLEPAHDNPEIKTDDLTSEVNRNYGRRFEVVNFRWLKSEEI